jgi:hypothetical protein
MNKRQFLRNLAGALAAAMLPFQPEKVPVLPIQVFRMNATTHIGMSIGNIEGVLRVKFA